MATTVFGQAFPVKTMGVTDNADLLSDAQEQQINAVLADLDREKGIEFHVVTLSLVGNYMKDATVDQYAELLFDKWDIGANATSGGVLFLVSQHDNDLHIVLSLGHERRLDTAFNDFVEAELKYLVERVMVPAFRLGYYGVGIQQGVDKITREVTGDASYQINDNRSRFSLKARISGLVFIGLAPVSFLIFLT